MNLTRTKKDFILNHQGHLRMFKAGHYTWQIHEFTRRMNLPDAKQHFCVHADAG